MNSDTIFVALAIVSSSFWGSWHCAAMCGPVASIAAGREALLSYHLGRGISYITLGTFGGYLGSFFLASEFQRIRMISSILFALLLIFMGVQTMRGGPLLGVATILRPKFVLKRSNPVFILGLFSVFLPCGWLYTYVLAAVATQSPWAGALVMSLFWIGGLPALSALSAFMKASMRSAPKKKRALAGVVLTAAGLYSLFSFYYLPTLFR